MLLRAETLDLSTTPGLQQTFHLEVKLHLQSEKDERQAWVSTTNYFPFYESPKREAESDNNVFRGVSPKNLSLSLPPQRFSENM